MAYYKLVGIAASPGKAKGRARVIKTLRDLQNMKPGEIIVAPMTDPNMTPFLTKAKAIVTDSGGLTSHAAIIARELGIPAVVGTQYATQTIKTGMLIEVDGTKGTVTILDLTPQQQETKTNNLFTIFGNKVPTRKIKPPRTEPLYPPVYDFPWRPPPPEVTVANPRPEIQVTPITITFVIPGMERVPYNLGFRDIPPMYTFLIPPGFYTDINVLKATMERSRQILLNNEKWEHYKKMLHKNYKEFDKTAEELQRKSRNKNPEDIILDDLISYWKTQNKFFSTTYLIQAWGDDIIWPLITRKLEEKYDKATVKTILLKATKIVEKQIPSVKFREDLRKAASSLPDNIKQRIITDNTDTKVTEQIIENEAIRDLLSKWGWVRHRDFYCPNLKNEKLLVAYIKSALHEPEGQEEKPYTTQIDAIRDEEILYLLDVGITLKIERDRHHFIWLKNTTPLKEIIDKIAQKHPLKENIYFLTLPELTMLLQGEVNTENAREKAKKRREVYTRLC